MNNKAGIAFGNQALNALLISRLVFSYTFLLRKSKHFNSMLLWIVQVSWRRRPFFTKKEAWAKSVSDLIRIGNMAGTGQIYINVWLCREWVIHFMIQPGLHWEQLLVLSSCSINVWCLSDYCSKMSYHNNHWSAN